ncbi:MAG: hypothetical protein IKV80_08315 [Bacteroidales bacterium]|nr:hypothetical protein [Bacteroidales bacterium]
MNTTFSLSKQKEKVFPDYIQYDGNTFFINADFRNILRIMRMYDDDSILQIQKPYLLLKWFFRDEIDEVTGIDLFKQFMGTADENDSQSEQQFDFEFDAKEIYASFLKEYFIDLVDIPFLHWRKFIILLSNLSDECPFRQKIRLRFMDLKDYKGEQLVKLQEAKDAVQLPVRYTREELEEMRQFEAEWG